MAKQIVEMIVDKVIQETPDTKTLHLTWPAEMDYQFKTGQFITIYLPEEPQTKRAYSLSSCAMDRGYFEITIKTMGHFGTRINQIAKEGMKLMVIPPVGKFTMPEDLSLDLLMIAGGSGVTPFRAFVREHTYRKTSTKLTVLYSVRTPPEAIFLKEFKELEQQNPNFSFKLTCTRSTPEHGYNGSWEGRHGRINADWVKENVRDFSKTVFYACGPNELVAFAERLVVEELKVPKPQMRTEKWGDIKE